MKHIIIAFSLVLFFTACSSQKEVVDTNAEFTEKQTKQSKSKDGRMERPSIDEVFEMDANNDNKLSKTEIKGPLLDNFDTIDTDGDGFISKAELENAPRPKRRQRRSGN